MRGSRSKTFIASCILRTGNPPAAPIETAIYEHKHYDIDYRTVSPTGEVKWIRAVGRGFYDLDGRPISFDGVTMDITAHQ